MTMTARRHHVWMLDAASGWNQLRVAACDGRSFGVALWRLGSEDPGVWQRSGAAAPGTGPARPLGTICPLDQCRCRGQWRNPADRRDADRSAAARRADGDGPDPRRRVLRSLPTPYVVRRTGYRPKQLALTFDDGPDPDWTPQILDILKREARAGDLLRRSARMRWRSRCCSTASSTRAARSATTATPIPIMATASPRGTRLELNATQRLVEAYTGRSHAAVPRTLFRRCRADHRGRTVPGAGGAAARLSDRRPARRSGRLASARRRSDRRRDDRPGASRRRRSLGQHHPAPRWRRRSRADGRRAAADHRPVARARLPLRAGLALAGLSPRAGDAARSRAAICSRCGSMSASSPSLAAIGCALKWMFFVAISLGIARASLMAGAGAVARAARTGQMPPPIDTDRLRLGAHPGLQRGARDRGVDRPRAGERRCADRSDRHRRRIERRHQRGRRARPSAAIRACGC